MALTLRHYQNKSIDHTFEWMRELRNPEENGLIVLPTGTGKSLVIAKLCEIITKYPDMRIIIPTHSKELVEQNYLEFMALMPFADAGIYSAGLNRRDQNARILFCGIQSVYNKAFKIQRCDFMLPDEAQGISRKGQSMWGQFIKDLKIINPDMVVIGLTATPFRLDSGKLIGGEGAIFHKIVYEYPLLDAVCEGYLCEIIPKSMATKLCVAGVKKRGGDFIESQLQKAVNIDAVTKAAVQEILEYGKTRKSWLTFGSGVDHAIAINEEIKRHGIVSEVIYGDMPKKLRKEYIEAHKNYEIQSLVNNKVLTTGYNHKGIDLIADLNPTESEGLHVQKLGRGTRTIIGEYETVDERLHAIAISDKPDCVLLDFAGNVARHGFLDQIKGRDYKEKDGMGVPPMKDCPECNSIVYAGLRICKCGYKFPEPELKINSQSHDNAVMSSQQVVEEKEVTDVRYSLHAKPNKTPSMRVDYMIGDFEKYSEWICVEHKGFAREKAEHWWKKRHPMNLDAPTDAKNAVELAVNLKTPGKIWVIQDGKFWKIKKYDFVSYDVPPAPLMSESQFGDSLSELLQDEIPMF